MCVCVCVCVGGGGVTLPTALPPHTPHDTPLPVIVPYYLFATTELRNVLFINFVYYFTEFKVREFKFVFLI